MCSYFSHFLKSFKLPHAEPLTPGSSQFPAARFIEKFRILETNLHSEYKTSFFSSSFPSTYFQLYFSTCTKGVSKGVGNSEVGLPFESEINNFSLQLGRQTNCRINSKSQLVGQGKERKKHRRIRGWQV